MLQRVKIKPIGWTKVSKKDQNMSDIIYGRSCWVNEKAACFSQYDVHVFIVVSVMLWKNKKKCDQLFSKVAYL